MVQGPGGATYVYDHAGKRVKKANETSWEYYFYGVGGQKLVTLPCTSGGCSAPQYNVYFGGKLVKSKGVLVVTDRLGSVRVSGNLGVVERMSYYPYGEEKTSTGDDREKFGTYTRDNAGQDYADQRYYAVGAGRFGTPDRSKGAHRGAPSTWNKYLYVVGDPINFYDPRGREVWNPSYCPPEDENCAEQPGGGGSGAGGGSGQGGSGGDDPEPDPGDDPCGGEGGAQFAPCSAPEPPPPAPPPPPPGCSNWGCMPAALAQAREWLKQPECAALFGTSGTRMAGFDPTAVLNSVYTPGGGPWGAGTFAYIPYPAAAITVPVALTVPGPTPIVYGVTALVAINELNVPGTNAWNQGDTFNNALLLLHELGHVYNILPGSGGSQIQWDFGGIGGISTDNDNLVIQKCAAVSPTRR
jgi:RHS repeat-associated protein